jgi:deoxycytidylate deaminase
MTSFPDKLQVMKVFTNNLATLSKCYERKVAAVITNSDLSQVFSCGVNGGPKGLQDCMCKADEKYGCMHAELNALIKCTANDTNKVMFITLSPCKICAAGIINAPGSFKTIYYFEEWKDNTGIKLLQAAGIYTVLL